MYVENTTNKEYMDAIIYHFAGTIQVLHIVSRHPDVFRDSQLFQNQTSIIYVNILSFTKHF